MILANTTQIKRDLEINEEINDKYWIKTITITSASKSGKLISRSLNFEQKVKSCSAFITLHKIDIF